MSRSYTFAVEVHPVQDTNECEEIQLLIEDEMGCSVDFWYADDTSTGYFDSTEGRLCGGETENEAHMRLSQAILRHHSEVLDVSTKWLCTEYQEWDSEYTMSREDLGDEDEEEVNEEESC